MRSQCSVDGCDGPVNANNLCMIHYSRMRKYGRLDLLQPGPPTSERFWSRVDKAGPLPASHPEFGNCWISSLPMVGSPGNYYPGIKVGGRMTRGHRFAVEQAMGTPIPIGRVILHTCDDTRCVRNDEPGTYEVAKVVLPRWGHLALGTTQDNQRDMAIKGRSTMGERNGNAHVTTDDVRRIRERATAGERSAALQVEYGLSKASLYRIRARKTWKHI